MEIVNQTIRYSLLAAGAIVIALLLRDLWKPVRPVSGQMAPLA